MSQQLDLFPQQDHQTLPEESNVLDRPTVKAPSIAERTGFDPNPEPSEALDTIGLAPAKRPYRGNVIGDSETDATTNSNSSEADWHLTQEHREAAKTHLEIARAALRGTKQ